jgi:hypothetical protein
MRVHRLQSSHPSKARAFINATPQQNVSNAVIANRIAHDSCPGSEGAAFCSVPTQFNWRIVWEAHLEVQNRADFGAIEQRVQRLAAKFPAQQNREILEAQQGKLRDKREFAGFGANCSNCAIEQLELKFLQGDISICATFS